MSSMHFKFRYLIFASIFGLGITSQPVNAFPTYTTFYGAQLAVLYLTSYLTDQSMQGTPGELLLPFIPAIAGDKYSPKEGPRIIASATVNAALQSRALIFQEYQEKLYAHKGLRVNKQLEEDIRQGLKIFYGYSNQEAASMSIVMLHPDAYSNLGKACDSSLGIFATNKIIFVDEEFLLYWRRTNQVMYSFFVGYGLSQVKKQTYFKRQMIGLTDVVTSTLFREFVSSYCNQQVYAGAAKIGWRSLGDIAGDSNRGFLAGMGLLAARIALVITTSTAANALYTKLTQSLKENLYKSMEGFDGAIIVRLQKFHEMLFKTNLPLNALDFVDRITYVQVELGKFINSGQQSPMRLWLVNRIISTLESKKESIKAYRKKPAEKKKQSERLTLQSIPVNPTTQQPKPTPLPSKPVVKKQVRVKKREF